MNEMDKLTEKVRKAIRSNGWKILDDHSDEEQLTFEAGDEWFIYIIKNNGNEIDSICLLYRVLEFGECFIPDMYIFAGMVNNRHTCAHVAVHSKRFEPDAESNLFGFEFHAPKAGCGDLKEILKAGVGQLVAIAEDFDETWAAMHPQDEE